MYDDVFRKLWNIPVLALAILVFKNVNFVGYIWPQCRKRNASLYGSVHPRTASSDRH